MLQEKVSKIVKKEKLDYGVLKVTPHISNLNSMSRKFMSVLHTLLSSYDKGLIKGSDSILLKKDIPRLWWVIKVTNSNEEKNIKQEDRNITSNKKTIKQKQKDGLKIEFFIILPNSFINSFLIKFNGHKQWSNSKIEKVENFDWVNMSFTDGGVLKLKRNNMFSLNYDYTQQESPIRDILSIGYDLSEGESYYVVIGIEPYNSLKWLREYDYAKSIWNKGGYPTRVGINVSRVIENTKKLISLTSLEISKFVDDTINGLKQSFFVKSEDVKTERDLVFIDKDREEVISMGSFDKTNKKRTTPVFKTDIYFLVDSKDKVKGKFLLNSLSNAYKDLKGLNEFELHEEDVKNMIKNLKDNKLFTYDYNILSTDELGKCIQLPTADLQREFDDALSSIKRIQVDVDKEFLNDSGIFSGTVSSKGNKIPVYLPTDSKDMLFTTKVIMGSPRMGKDQKTINLVVEAKRHHGIGSVILDTIDENVGHRGMGDAVRDHLDPKDVIDIDLSNTDYAVYLGISGIFEGLANERVVGDRVAEEICEFLLLDSDLDKVRTVDYLRESAKFTNGDLLGIHLMFTSDSYRKEVIEKKKHLYDTYLWEMYDNLSDEQKMQIYSPIMRRLGQIMNSEILKPMFCQSKENSKFDLTKWVLEGKVVIFRMKIGGVLSKRIVQILSHWLVTSVFLINMLRGKDRKCEGTFLVLNEPYTYMTDNLVELLKRVFSEGAKHRLSALLIFHNFKQFHSFPSFIEVMKSSSLDWYLFKNTNIDVYKMLFSYLHNTFETYEMAFESTSMRQFIAIWKKSDGSYASPFLVDAPPLVTDRYKTLNNGYLTTECIKKYGVKSDDVIKDIRNKIRKYQNPIKDIKKQKKR